MILHEIGTPEIPTYSNSSVNVANSNTTLLVIALIAGVVVVGMVVFHRRHNEQE
jgi:hypothetical protein